MPPLCLAQNVQSLKNTISQFLRRGFQTVSFPRDISPLYVASAQGFGAGPLSSSPCCIHGLHALV